MKITRNFVVYRVIPCIFVCLLAGCQNTMVKTETSLPKNNSSDIKQHTPAPSLTPAPLRITNKETVRIDKSNLEISSNVPAAGDKASASSVDPTLMGLTINDTLNSVTKRFGEPVNKYYLVDDQEQIAVYEYTGFSIGFVPVNHIKFINVNSGSLDPGLNGLRLGQTVEEAIRALGEPYKNTEYVLNYVSNGVVLKLDVDPKTKLINSIKLFAE